MPFKLRLSLKTALVAAGAIAAISSWVILNRHAHGTVHMSHVICNYSELAKLMPEGTRVPGRLGTYTHIQFDSSDLHDYLTSHPTAWAHHTINVVGSQAPIGIIVFDRWRPEGDVFSPSLSQQEYLNRQPGVEHVNDTLMLLGSIELLYKNGKPWCRLQMLMDFQLVDPAGSEPRSLSIENIIGDRITRNSQGTITYDGRVDKKSIAFISRIKDDICHVILYDIDFMP